MFLDKALDEIGRKNKIVIGLDLTNDYVQISYCRLDQSMPDTVSLVMGEEQYIFQQYYVGSISRKVRRNSGSLARMHCRRQKMAKAIWQKTCFY